MNGKVIYRETKRTNKTSSTISSLNFNLTCPSLELQVKQQTYSADAANQTQITNQARAEELQSMQQNIQKFEQTAAQDLQKKQQDMMGPLIEKARAAIKKVADGQGFDYVLDASPNGAVLMAKGKDLMTDVKSELGF